MHMVDRMDLVYELSNFVHGPLASIEILPGSLDDWKDIDLPPGTKPPSAAYPFVFVEGNLGIPKKILYALYITAIQAPWRSSDIRVAMAASAIIVFTNPSHQTALNHRKRLIEEGHLLAGNELKFIELISRGSPECGKQSTIWDHRRWCFQQMCGALEGNRQIPHLDSWARSEEMGIFPKMLPTTISHELDIVYRTCETYTRNYHAWSYWHSMINICYVSIYWSDDENTKRNFFGVITEQFRRLQEWVNLHVSDFSAMHQLCQAQTLIQHLEHTMSSIMDLPYESSTKLPLWNHALSLVSTYPNHESLWMYLRISLAGIPPQTRNNILDQIQTNYPFETNQHAKQLCTWFAR